MPGYEPQAFMSNRLERVLLCDVHCFSPLFVCGFVDDCHATLRRLRMYDCATVFSFAEKVHRSLLCYQHHHYCHSVNFRRRDHYE